MATRMCDLPEKLIGEKILTRVPITSLREVRSTCKSWEALTKSCILGNAATGTQQFLGFVTMNSKVCSLSFHHKKEEVSINQVDLLNQVEISQVFHCDGLLLCVAKDSSKLVVWNPYLYQTRCIVPTQKFPIYGMCALGYDMNRNHKILRFADNVDCSGTGPPERITVCEIYEIRSNSWRVLEGSVPIGKQNVFAAERLSRETPTSLLLRKYATWNLKMNLDGCLRLKISYSVLILRERDSDRACLFRFTHMALSCVRDEQLAVMYCKDGVNDNLCGSVEIWVTTRIEPDSVSLEQVSES